MCQQLNYHFRGIKDNIIFKFCNNKIQLFSLKRKVVFNIKIYNRIVFNEQLILNLKSQRIFVTNSLEMLFNNSYFSNKIFTYYISYLSTKLIVLEYLQIII